ncbi:MAG: DUF3536 domain-containing protein [candidate division WOR-3 bacterium]
MLVVFHLHFYQPPRKNPITEEYEIEESAYPFENWNERISKECYERIIPLPLRNLSSNWGPTLIEWMVDKKRNLLKGIRKVGIFHKTYIMQPYYHIIMPLADKFMKEANTIWGIRFFEKVFGYKPKGVWLPECAVDLETLKIMKKYGIKFTILGEDQVYGARGSGLYRIAGIEDFYTFVFDREASGKIAFSDENFYEREMIKYLKGKLKINGVLIVATDGETFGHHKKWGIRFLRKLLNQSMIKYSLNDLFSLLEPKGTVAIKEFSSWSCPHGVRRWQDDCGCSTGANPNWNQKWRKPLRDALDWLRNIFYNLYFEYANSIGVDGKRLLLNHNIYSTPTTEPILRLAAAYQYVVAMYTSCAWFFDDISGREAQIAIAFAAKVIKTLEEVTGYHIEDGFLNKLAYAKSNIPDLGTGREVYKKLLKSNFNS